MSIRNGRQKRRRNWPPIVVLIGLAGVIITAARMGKLEALKKHCEHCCQTRCCCNQEAASTENEQAAADPAATAAD